MHSANCPRQITMPAPTRPPLSFLQNGCPSCHPTNSVKALKDVLNSLYTPHKTANHYHIHIDIHSFKNTQIFSPQKTNHVTNNYHTTSLHYSWTTRVRPIPWWHLIPNALIWSVYTDTDSNTRGDIAAPHTQYSYAKHMMKTLSSFSSMLSEK